MQYLISFLEGIITFISPCLLPMLPIYVSYFAGGGERSTARTLRGALGFVLGFIPAAFDACWFAERAWDRRPVLAMTGFVAASVVHFLVGVPYLAMILNAVMGAGADLGAVLAAGLWPFIPGGLVKAALAALLIPAAWKGVRALDERR